MRLDFDVKLKGLDKILSKLDVIGDAHKEKAFEESLAAGGAVAVSAAKDLVPVDTGRLHDSLHVGGYTKLTPGWRKIGKYGSLRKPEGKGRSVLVFLGSTLPYAHLVERGTRTVAARSFIRRGIDGSERKIMRTIDDKVQEMIDEA